MMPVYQEITDHNEAEGRFGDCYRACVASMLGMRLLDVPHFVMDAWNGTNYNADYEIRAVREWLKPRDLGLVVIACESLFSDSHYQGVMAIVTGRGPRNLNHCCIYRGGELYHDPHPIGGGLIGPCKEDSFYWHEFFVPLDYLAAYRATEQQESKP